MKYLELDKINIISTTVTELEQHIRVLLNTKSNSHLIITYNLDFHRIAYENGLFKTLCQNCELVLPDGFGITSLLKLRHKEQVYRITGTNIFEMLCKIANLDNYKIALVGSQKTVLEEVKKKLKNLYPKLNICATIAPPNYFDQNPTENKLVIESLIKAQPDILFLALGCPRQEFWLEKYKDVIGSKFNIGVGAVFDFYSGRKKRSPVFLQKMGLEWFWRLINEPTRLFNRYIILDIPTYIREIYKIRIEKK